MDKGVGLVDNNQMKITVESKDDIRNRNVATDILRLMESVYMEMVSIKLEGGRITMEVLKDDS